MDEELAKQLQEAGFPLQAASLADSQRRIPMFEHGLDSLGRTGIWLYPTLSQLIEACGFGFETLTRARFGHDENDYWQTAGRRTDYKNNDPAEMASQYTVFAKGKIPEIAVAKLWLVLNKK